MTVVEPDGREHLAPVDAQSTGGDLKITGVTAVRLTGEKLELARQTPGLRLWKEHRDEWFARRTG